MSPQQKPSKRPRQAEPEASGRTGVHGDSAGDPSRSVQAHADDPQRRTRLGGAWTALAVAVIVLVILLIFILQNQQLSDVNFFGATGTLPLGVLVLLSATGGALLVIVLGVARMVQLKASARRERRARQPGRGGRTSD